MTGHPTAKGGTQTMSQAPNQNQLEALLKVAAQRMGTTPQAQKLFQMFGNQGK